MSALDWGYLQVFLAVARTGQISRAGQQLGLNHATVGRHIARLERGLKARLFDRSPRGYALTQAGERLLARAEAMESAALGAQSEIGDADLQLTGSVRIGAPDGFGSFFLAPRIGAFCRAHPALELQILAMPRSFSLSKREADIACGPTVPDGARLVTSKLTDYTLRLFGTERYFAERGVPASVADLRRHRGIGYIQDLIFTPQLDYISEIASGLKPRLTSSNLVAQLQAALSGAGLCVLPDFLAGGFPELVPVLSETVVLRRSMWLVMHSDTRSLARIRLAADFIRAQVEAERNLFLPNG